MKAEWRSLLFDTKRHAEEKISYASYKIWESSRRGFVKSPTSLSGGVKTLILIKEMPEQLFNASNCEDNCAGWLLRIGEKRDVTVNLRHIMDCGEKPFEIHVVNTDQIVRDMDSLARIAGRFV